MKALRLPYAELSPGPLNGLRQSLKAIADGPLDPRLVELLYLRVSQINGCAYCLGLHSDSLRRHGESQARLDALAGWRISPLFTPAERAALQWAEALTDIAGSHAPDADFEPLAAHFGEREIADLSYAVAVMNALNRMAVGMRQ